MKGKDYERLYDAFYEALNDTMDKLEEECCYRDIALVFLRVLDHKVLCNSEEVELNDDVDGLVG